MGGIMTATDAIEFVLAGATAVQVGTANFINPAVIVEIVDGIASYLEKNNYQSIQELIGAMESLKYFLGIYVILGE